MLRRPSEIVEVWITASRAAKRIGAKFELNRERLAQWGFNESQIQGIVEEVEFLEKQEREQKLRFAHLNARV